MVLGPTDLFESNENIMFCSSNLLVGLKKKGVLMSVFSESEKYLCEGFIFSFVFSSIVAKYLLKTFEISAWFVMLDSLEDKQI